MKKAALEDFAVTLVISFDCLGMVFELYIGKPFALSVALLHRYVNLKLSAVVQQEASTTECEGGPISDKRDIY
jgi:hypothetical protein